MSLELKEFLTDELGKFTDQQNKSLASVQDGTKGLADRIEAIDKDQKSASSEANRTLEKLSNDVASATKLFQEASAAVDDIKKQLSRPEFGNKSDRDDALHEDFELHIKSLSAEGIKINRDKVDFSNYQLALKAIDRIFNTKEADPRSIHITLPQDEIKALTELNFSNGGAFFSPPALSNRILRCIQDPTSLVSMPTQMTLSKGELTMLVDNTVDGGVEWADKHSCDVNKSVLTDGFSTKTLTVHDLRAAQCVSPAFLEDAEIDVASYLSERLGRGFQSKLSEAIMSGDGVLKPLGLLNPGSQVPVYQTNAAAAPGEITSDDLIALKWAVHESYHSGSEFYMNQATYAKLLSMKDANGRHIMFTDIAKGGARSIEGSPVRIVTQMPNISAGAKPVMYVNIKEAYTLGRRRNVTFQRDDYSAGFCTLFKWRARVGGLVTCTKAASLLEIR